MKTGKIRIKDKVYFEYYKLKLPPCHKVGREAYFKSLDKYEASKQLIEVSNDYYINKSDFLTGDESATLWIKESLEIKDVFKINGVWNRARNNQPCKAEITNNTATIIELIK